MEKRDFIAISQEILNRIGKSLVHWTNYIASVNRINVLSEYAIRYATSEFLEVEREKRKSFILKEQSQSITLDYFLKEYEYEHCYPCYVGDKHADLFFSLGCSQKEHESVVFTNYIEFKYIKNSNNRFKEFSSDIRRLAVLNKNVSSSSSYFVIFGKRSSMVAPPKQIKDTTKANIRNDDTKKWSIDNYYGELLSFDLDSDKRIVRIKKSALSYVGKIESWGLNQGFKELSDEDEIISELVFTNYEKKVSIEDSVLIYIWRIDVKTDVSIHKE
jgi:hypothetical protein